MSVYVDDPRPCRPTARWRWDSSSHLVADSLEELHRFAQSIGLRREWFQPQSFPHYDLTKRRRAQALKGGAVRVDRRELVAVMRRYRAIAIAAPPAHEES